MASKTRRFRQSERAAAGPGTHREAPPLDVRARPHLRGGIVTHEVDPRSADPGSAPLSSLPAVLQPGLQQPPTAVLTAEVPSGSLTDRPQSHPARPAREPEVA
jgi:hypothetical protein